MVICTALSKADAHAGHCREYQEWRRLECDGPRAEGVLISDHSNVDRRSSHLHVPSFQKQPACLHVRYHEQIWAVRTHFVTAQGVCHFWFLRHPSVHRCHRGPAGGCHGVCQLNCQDCTHGDIVAWRVPKQERRRCLLIGTSTPFSLQITKSCCVVSVLLLCRQVYVLLFSPALSVDHS